MSTAKKQEIPEPDDSSDELDFDVSNDWRKEADKAQANLFKEDDMEVEDDDMDTSIFQLDTKGEIVKEQAKEHSKAMAAARKHSRTGKKGKSDTLQALQDAANGGEGDGEDELEILTEEDKALVNDPIFTNKGNEYPQIHGNYFLLDHLVDGGMAKVCRARYLGEGDEADKMVAIKMVQEKFSADESFVQMFVDEIKVSFGLNHPNINTTFDYGKIGKNLFVSMEYIHGKDLMVVIDELKKNKETIPVPMAIYIASKMSEALHYAHNFTNKLTGQKYNIVHRDISPHNAMVSYEGFVKVIDFGIAKADTNTTEEAEGTIKGKINYFAPEYLEGKKINHRYDQFAVGLTLWEMLTGEKTFKAADQLLTLKKILECNPELPSRYNKEIPKDLEQVVMKALSKDPADRYKDMQAFNRALMKVLYKNFPDFHESDISEMMKNLFQDSYENDLDRFKEFGKYSISDIVKKINAFKDFQKRQKEKAQSGAGKAKEAMFDFGFSEESISARAGKKGLDKLITGKKKERPGLDTSKSQRKRQKALAALLEEDDDFQKADSVLERNKGKIIFIVILALGFFQKEMIMNILFGANTSNGISKRAHIYQKSQQIKEIEKVKNKHQENMKFIEQLKKENKEPQKQVDTGSGKKVEAAQAPQTPTQKASTATEPSQVPKVEPANIKPEVTSFDEVKEILNKGEGKERLKDTEQINPSPNIAEKNGTSDVPTQNINQAQEPQVAQPQRQPAAENTRPSRGRPAVTSFKEAKKILDETLNKEKARNIEGALQAARPALTQPEDLKEDVKQAADIDSLSVDELRARMEAQLAKKKRELVPEVNSKRPLVKEEKVTSGQSSGLGASEDGSSEGSYQAEAYEGESFEGESLPEESSAGIPSQKDNSYEVSESKNIVEEGLPVGSLNDSAKEALANLKKKQEAALNPKESPEVKSEQGSVATKSISQQTQAQDGTNTTIADKKDLSQAEIQILQLKAKMARIQEEQRKLEEGGGLKKLDITLSDEEKQDSKEAQDEKSRAEIQRELASRLDDITEEGEEVAPNDEKGVVDGVVDFLKTRRAFGWMFD